MLINYGVCSHYTHNASYSPFYAINQPKILCKAIYTNQYSESVTFSVAVTYTYNTVAYIIPISLQMHYVNMTVAVCMFQIEMSHDQ